MVPSGSLPAYVARQRIGADEFGRLVETANEERRLGVASGTTRATKPVESRFHPSIFRGPRATSPPMVACSSSEKL
jgi:hypothetical protein